MISSVSVDFQAQLAVAIEKAEASKIASICEQVSLDVEPLSKMLDQLSGHCSKDVISVSSFLFLKSFAFYGFSSFFK